MADPFKVFTGLLDALGETAAATKSKIKPLKVAKAAVKGSEGYFDDLLKKSPPKPTAPLKVAKTAAKGYFGDIFGGKAKQNVPPAAPKKTPGEAAFDALNGPKPPSPAKTTADETQKALDAIYEALGLPKPEPAPKPAPTVDEQLAEYLKKAKGVETEHKGVISPTAAKTYEDAWAQQGANPPKPTFAQQAVKTAQKQALAPGLPPTVKPPTMHPDVLPEPQRQAARLKGNYVTEVFRGLKDFQGTYKGYDSPYLGGGDLYSSVSPKLADLYTSYIGKHPGLNPASGSYHEGASVVPLWIDTSAYLHLDAKGKMWTQFNAAEIKKAKDAGKYKGVVIDNVWDEPNSTKSLEGPQKIFVTFLNGQGTVKSKFAARFDPTSKDMSRSIAAVGITGAAGTIAMAPGEAKAGEDPGALPENAQPTEGRGYFADVFGDERPAKGQGYFDDIPAAGKSTGGGLFDDIPAQPTGKRGGMFDDIPAAQPTEGQGYFADVVKAKEKPGYFADLLDQPKEGHVAAIKRASSEIYQEGVKEYKEGLKGAVEQLQPENLRTYNAYEDAYRKWEDSGGKGDPPKPPEGVGPVPFMRALLGVGSGFMTAVSPAVGAGIVRAELSEPLEKKYGVPKWVTESVASLGLPVIGVVKYGKAVAPAVRATVGAFNKFFNPEKIGAGARAATLERNALGIAARDTETTRADFNQYWAQVDAMKQQDQLLLTAYIEGRTGGATLHDVSLQPVADAYKKAMELRKTKLQALPSTHQMAFVEDYYSHMWKDPQKAAQFTAAWVAKQGTGKNLKKRIIPTIADGIAAGLEPVSYNPLEIGMRYVENMDRFVAHNAVFDAGRATGDIKYFLNKGSAEAPWHPAAEKLGMVPLRGRLATKKTPVGEMFAAADQDFARVYNNAIGKGFHGVKGPYGQTISDGYSTLQRASNNMTAMELGFSGFHFATMAQEAVVSDFALALGQAVGAVHALGQGAVKDAAKLLAGSAWSALRQPVAFARKPLLGHKGQQIYLGRTPGTAQNRELIDLLESGGGRAVGYNHARDYQFSAGYSYLQSFQRFSDLLNKNAYMSLVKSVKGDYAPGKVLPAPAAFFARQVGRAMATVAEPLFKTYIPKMKTGAFMDNMKAWLDANPAASYPDRVEMAQKVWDSIDNRMGELVQDNIFWPTMLKQVAQLGMRSYSWNLGTIREIGGGASKLARQPSSASIRGGTNYDPRTGYVVALPMVAAMSMAIYQYMKTGKPPRDLDDLMHARTGGMVPGTGGRALVEERANLPSYMKDVFGWYEDWRQEAYNKLNVMASTAWELSTNQQGPLYRREPIIGDEESVPEWLRDYFFYAERFLPISVKSSMRTKKGSNISTLERQFGVAPAGQAFTDPKGLAAAKHAAAERERRNKLYEEQKNKRVYGGPTG